MKVSISIKKERKETRFGCVDFVHAFYKKVSDCETTHRNIRRLHTQKHRLTYKGYIIRFRPPPPRLCPSFLRNAYSLGYIKNDLPLPNTHRPTLNLRMSWELGVPVHRPRLFRALSNANPLT